MDGDNKGLDTVNPVLSVENSAPDGIQTRTQLTQSTNDFATKSLHIFVFGNTDNRDYKSNCIYIRRIRMFAVCNLRHIQG